MENGKRSGRGNFLSKNIRYSGNWKNDKPSANGRLDIENSDSKATFIGEWRNGLPHGKGEYKTPKFHYIGNWSNGKASGQGALKAIGNVKYSGGWDDGLPHGKGNYIGVDQRGRGQFFTGNWNHGTVTVKVKRRTFKISLFAKPGISIQLKKWR